MADGMDMDNAADISCDAGYSSKSHVNPAIVSPAVLAFIGDAVYEAYVRRYVYEKGILRPDRLNYAAVSYVRAETQALILDRLLPEMSADEASVARRGRNHKITSMPHNLEPRVYRKATAFEAVIGYLDLKGDRRRLEFLINRAFEIAESEKAVIVRRRGD